jgi:hypothetical protein
MYTNPVKAPTNYLPGYTVANARLSWLAPGTETRKVAREVTRTYLKIVEVS